MSGQLAPALDGVRLCLHVLGATVWVGGQITLAGLVGPARQLGEDTPRRLARAFARLSWPAYVLVVGTGIWNVVAVHQGKGRVWQIVLGIKIAVALLAGLTAWLHGRARARAAIAVYGALAGVCSLAALFLGVFLAG
ncbi:MAG: hypothetical protein M0004_03855 [Actinomycetota bacterium]|nr:hypothetical protein [Actinomycetota bacterium]